nr:immunoglobulin heavy chain junction region [Macaca mulatta]MOV51104.1 immunoglobulin heavy chain junction region [Macaca mulatta]
CARWASADFDSW